MTLLGYRWTGSELRKVERFAEPIVFQFRREHGRWVFRWRPRFTGGYAWPKPE